MNSIVINVKGTDIIEMSDTSKVHNGVSVRFLDMHKILFHNFLFLKENCRLSRQFFFCNYKEPKSSEQADRQIQIIKKYFLRRFSGFL